ncbi:MAG: PRC-barrel domain-containing protein [Tistlia sp.]|uniref:PRC-barrel domain-containing protein n=1 Tax=Tistlia sp. TaxID=3057121 RepID=UPI0034A5D4E4
MKFKHLLSATTVIALSLGAAGAMAASDSAATTNTTATGATAGSAGTSAGMAGAGERAQVAEACMEELNEAERSMGEEGRVVPGRHLRTLHEAATIFAQAGMEDACESVVEGIREYGEQRAEAGAMGDEERAEYRDRVQNAKPLSEVDSRYRVGSLIGDSVVGIDGETIGDVDDVMISSDGSARYVLIGTGGFLGIGEEYTPVDTSQLRVVDEDTLVLSIEAETFEQAPRVERDRIDTDLETWANDVEVWWAEHVTQKASAQ